MLQEERLYRAVVDALTQDRLTLPTLPEVAMRRDPSGGEFPYRGSALFTVLAERLNSADPNDHDALVDAQVLLVFDDTEIPEALVSGDLEGTGPSYRYTINLKTGAIARL